MLQRIYLPSALVPPRNQALQRRGTQGRFALLFLC